MVQARVPPMLRLLRTRTVLLISNFFCTVWLYSRKPDWLLFFINSDCRSNQRKLLRSALPWKVLNSSFAERFIVWLMQFKSWNKLMFSRGMERSSGKKGFSTKIQTLRSTESWLIDQFTADEFLGVGLVFQLMMPLKFWWKISAFSLKSRSVIERTSWNQQVASSVLIFKYSCLFMVVQLQSLLTGQQQLSENVHFRYSLLLRRTSRCCLHRWCHM